MLLGSQNTLGNLGISLDYLDALINSPVLFISPSDLFDEPYNSIPKTKKECADRLASVIRKYAGQDAKEFETTFRENESNLIQKTSDGVSFGFTVPSLAQPKRRFAAGAIFIPGNRWDTRKELALFAGLNRREISCAVEATDFLKAQMTAHEVCHFANPATFLFSKS